MANLYSRFIIFQVLQRSCVFGLGASSCACQVFNEIPYFQGAEKGRLPLVCPSYTTCAVRSHGFIVVFFEKIKTNSRTGCPFVLRGIGL